MDNAEILAELVRMRNMIDNNFMFVCIILVINLFKRYTVVVKRGELDD